MLAYFHYGADAQVAGFLFGAFGVGALLGALVAQQLTQKVELLKLAAFAIVAMPLPLFLLALRDAVAGGNGRRSAPSRSSRRSSMRRSSAC